MPTAVKTSAISGGTTHDGPGERNEATREMSSAEGGTGTEEATVVHADSAYIHATES